MGGGPGPGERPGYRPSLQTRTVVRSRLEGDDRTWKIWVPSLQHPPTRPVLLRVCGWWVGGWVCRCGWAPAPERACGALFTRIRPGLMATRPDSTYFLTSIALSQTCPFMLRRYTNPSPTWCISRPRMHPTILRLDKKPNRYLKITRITQSICVYIYAVSTDR